MVGVVLLVEDLSGLVVILQRSKHSPESLWTPLQNDWGRIGCNLGVSLFCLPSLVDVVGGQVLGLDNLEFP